MVRSTSLQRRAKWCTPPPADAGRSARGRMYRAFSAAHSSVRSISLPCVVMPLHPLLGNVTIMAAGRDLLVWNNARHRSVLHGRQSRRPPAAVGAKPAGAARLGPVLVGARLGRTLGRWQGAGAG